MRTKEDVERYRIKRAFGLDYDAILIDRRGRCGICGEYETVERNGRPKLLAIDHDHDTGQVRSFLCQRCNMLLGLAKEHPGILRTAADYLDLYAGRVICSDGSVLGVGSA